MNPLDVIGHGQLSRRTFYKVEDTEPIREALLEKGANYFFHVPLEGLTELIRPGEPADWGHLDREDALLRKRRRPFRETR